VSAGKRLSCSELLVGNGAITEPSLMRPPAHQGIRDEMASSRLLGPKTKTAFMQ
jgi:hypothetical protein